MLKLSTCWVHKHLKFSLFLFAYLPTGNSIIVNSSTWSGLGTLVSLAGPTGTFQGAPPDTALQLTSTTGNANGFNFIGRLQDYDAFTATYEVKCSGNADAIFFYFGGVIEPSTEWDSSSAAFEVANNIYIYNTYSDGSGQRVVATLTAGDIAIKQDSVFNSNTGSWIPMSVQYNRTASSFTVKVSAQGTLLLSSVVTGASAWFSGSSGSNWGIGARAGGLSGIFSFRRLQVIGSMNQANPCLSCIAGTYSTTAGDDVFFSFVIPAHSLIMIRCCKFRCVQ